MTFLSKRASCVSGDLKLSCRNSGFEKESQSLDVIIEPMDPAVQQAVQKIKQIDPQTFKNVTKIIVHSGGGAGQLGHVEKGPGKDPHEIHIFKDRIKELVQKQYRDVSDPKAIQDAISLALVEVIGHEAGHIGKFRTEEQITQTPFLGEPEAEAKGKELAQKVKPLFTTQAYLRAFFALDNLSKKFSLDMVEPNLSFIIKTANNDVKGIVDEGLSLLQSDTISPAMIEIDDAVDHNKKVIKDPKVVKILGIIQEKVGIKDFTSRDFVLSLAKLQSWMGVPVTGKLDKETVSKFNQPNKDLPRNFGVVVPGLIYRGGIIENEKQLEMLKKLFGIERIISLHKEESIPTMCESQNLEYYPALLEDGAADEKGRLLLNDNVAKVLEQKPTYVHCLFGQDRTGGVVARYRTEKGWPCELAYMEAKAYGFQDKFVDLIDWFCEPAEDKPPVDTKKIRDFLKSKEQDSIDSMPLNPVPNDLPFTSPHNPSEAHNYLIWSDTINNINPSMSINGVGAVGTAISCRVKKAYINEEDKVEKVKKDLVEVEKEQDGENPTDILANISGLRGDIKPEEPWGGFTVEPYFAAKGEPVY